MLFSKFFFWKTISLLCVASLINIIFVYSYEKHNFLAPSHPLSLVVSFLTFSLFLLLFLSSFCFFSPYILTVTNSGLSSSHRSLSLTISLLSFLRVFLPFYNTILWLDFFFSFTDQSIAPTCKGKQICSNNYFISFYQNPNSLLWISSLIFFFL